MSATILVLAHAADPGAGSVAVELMRRLGRRAVHVVRPEALNLASWSHRVDASGKATTRVTLPGGGSIDYDKVTAVLNRVEYLPVPRFLRTAVKDRDYAATEMQALAVSWLAGFGSRVVHEVREHPRLTPSLPRQRWAAESAACGLPVASHTFSRSAPVTPHHVRSIVSGDGGDSPLRAVPGETSTTVLVAGSRVGGPLASAFGAQCQQVARTLGVALLEFRFDIEAGRTVLTDVDPLPSLVEPWAAALAADLLQSLAAPEA